MIEAKVLSNIEIAPSVFVLSIPRMIEFLPGQVISLQLNKQQPRMYSIASGNKEDTLKILYDVKPDGKVTPLIKSLKKGDTVHISEAFGNFTGDDSPAYWIANGTGIAPFYAMFRSGLIQGKTLIHGARNKDLFYFQDEFTKELSNRYVRCSSQESGENLFRGRLTQYLKEQKFLPPNQKYYLCGSSEMVVEARDILIEKKVPFANIVAEIYF